MEICGMHIQGMKLLFHHIPKMLYTLLITLKRNTNKKSIWKSDLLLKYQTRTFKQKKYKELLKKRACGATHTGTVVSL